MVLNVANKSFYPRQWKRRVSSMMIGSIRNLKCGFMTLKNSLEFNKTWLAEHNNIFWNLFTFYEKWSVLRILCNLIFQKGVILKYDKSRFQLRALTLILTISLNTVLKFRGQTQTHKYHHIGAILVTRGAVIPSLLVDTCQGRVANVAPLSRCWPGCDAQLQGLWVGGLVTLSQYLTAHTGGTRTAFYSPWW